MPLPTKTEVQSLAFIFEGEPFTAGLNPDIDLLTLGMVFEGVPFTGATSTPSVTVMVDMYPVGM